MEYRAVYKCRLCGERYCPGYYDTDLRMVENHMEEMAAGIRGTPMTAYVSEKKIHNCADGNLGLSDFLGWKADPGPATPADLDDHTVSGLLEED